MRINEDTKWKAIFRIVGYPNHKPEEYAIENLSLREFSQLLYVINMSKMGNRFSFGLDLFQPYLIQKLFDDAIYYPRSGRIDYYIKQDVI